MATVTIKSNVTVKKKKSLSSSAVKQKKLKDVNYYDLVKKKNKFNQNSHKVASENEIQ
jgi:hypothetical protein